MILRRLSIAGLLGLCVVAGCLGYDEIEATPDEEINNRPFIESADPAAGVVTMKREESSKQFAITVSDPDGDRFFGYEWTLRYSNEITATVVGNGSFYWFQPIRPGLWQLVVRVWDCPGVGVDGDFSGLPNCQKAPLTQDSVTSELWVITVEP